MMTTRRSLRSAFSMVEIAMVVLLLALCLLPFMGFFQNQTRQTGHTQGRSLGMVLADQAMERFRTLSFDELLKQCGGAGLSDQELCSDPLLKLDTLPTAMRDKYIRDSYDRRVKFEEIPDPRVPATSKSTGPRVGLLTVTIKWKPQNLPATFTQLSKIVVGHRW